MNRSIIVTFKSLDQTSVDVARCYGVSSSMRKDLLSYLSYTLLSLRAFSRMATMKINSSTLIIPGIGYSNPTWRKLLKTDTMLLHDTR